MNEILTWVLVGLAGFVLGAFFFGGLWWTVRQGVSSPYPALLFLGSALLRLGVALTGFYLVGAGDWYRLVVCLVGFIVARFVVMGLTRPAQAQPKPPTQEARHAP